MRANSDRRWRHPWQVARYYHNGAIRVVCSHRTQRRAEWCLALQHTFSRTADGYDLDTRPNPRRTP
jgi:hypothetical protein